MATVITSVYRKVFKMLFQSVFVFFNFLLVASAMNTGYQYTTSSCRCGLNAECSIIQQRHVCSCIAGYRGDPLNKCTYSECESDSDCSSHQTCSINKNCVAACQSNSCGRDAQCVARNHGPICSCPSGYTGNANDQCRVLSNDEICTDQCGKNAVCQVRNSIIFCRCPLGYTGDARFECRPECENDSDCTNSRFACENNRCKNLCDKCGVNAVCDIDDNRKLNCSCPLNYLGDPYTKCNPECVTHDECGPQRHCFNSKCVNLCDGVCGINANCKLRDTTPVCSCPKNMTGDPFTQCRPFELSDLCDPNPCGLRAICKPGYDNKGNDRPVCICPSGFYGDALVECKKGECVADSNCSSTKACIDFNCQDVCISGVCGSGANCAPRNHIAVCTCPEGTAGNAKYKCEPNL